MDQPVQAVPEAGALLTPQAAGETALAAQRQAAGDMALLGRLRVSGRVLRRDGPFERRHPEVSAPFAARVERLAAAARPGAGTIRHKKSKRSKRR